MKKGEIINTTVTLECQCPHCSWVTVVILGREPEELDLDCDKCGETFTVKGYR